VVLAGDYNVIPAPEDVYDPKGWAGDALFLPQTRAKFRELLDAGYTEALRAVTDAPGQYTFWDYQAGAWQKNNGLRIDHLLLSPQAADRLKKRRSRQAVARRGKALGPRAHPRGFPLKLTRRAGAAAVSRARDDRASRALSRWRRPDPAPRA